MVSNYLSPTLVLLVALLIGTRGVAKSVIVDDDDTRIQYSSIGWIRNFNLDKTELLNGTLHMYECGPIACDTKLTLMV